MQFIGVIHAVLDRAILFQDWFWDEPEWFPKSQITVEPDHDSIAEVKVHASAWISRQKNLVEWEKW